MADPNQCNAELTPLPSVYFEWGNPTDEPTEVPEEPCAFRDQETTCGASAGSFGELTFNGCLKVIMEAREAAQTTPEIYKTLTQESLDAMPDEEKRVKPGH